MTCSKCDGRSFARGLCRNHYARAYRQGLKPLAVSYCGVEGCVRPHKGFGLCAFHLRRQRHGHPMSGFLRTPAAHRYVVIKRPTHPLAMANGRVALHRMVLHDAVRGGPLPCFWCGKPLSWHVDRLAVDALYVDHLDHNRRNNADTNLVPACNSCNAGRMRPGQRQSIYSPVGEDGEFIWKGTTEKVGT